MKKLILLLIILLFCSCSSQKKMSLRQMNDYLLKNNNLFPYSSTTDTLTRKMLMKGYTIYRLSGTKSCNIDPNKKFSNIYIEDGFNPEQGFYNGMIIIDNKDVCEITTSPYKLRLDSLSYTKVKEEYDAEFKEIVFYTKKLSMENFKRNYPNEYFRYQVVAQNKVEDLKKCLAIDEHLPKPYIYAVSYYFANKKINNYGILKINYNDVKDGIEGFPNLTKEKEKEFIDCVNSLVSKDSQ